MNHLRTDPPLPLDQLKKILSYSSRTGIFRWKKRRGNQKINGEIAGKAMKSGRRQIQINGRSVLAARVAWFFIYGEWPLFLIDHVNRKNDDDRGDNLRQANEVKNGQNRKRNANNSTGFKGVSLNNGKFRALITVDKKKKHLGYFMTAEAASTAYNHAARVEFGEFYPGVM